MRALPALLASVALVVSACSPDGDTASSRSTDPVDTVPTDATTPPDGTEGGSGPDDETGGGGAGRFPRLLTPFSDCSAFLDHVKSEAGARVGPYGLEGHQGYWIEDDVMVEEMAEDASAEPGFDRADSAPASAQNAEGAAAEDGGDFTGTNVQELGVDEPDIVKTDGDRILAVSENRLTYIDISSDPVLTDAIEIPEGWGHELFIRGDRALLFTNGGQWGYPMPIDIDVAEGDDAEAEFAEPDVDLIDIAPEQFGPATLIIEVDLSDPTNLRVASSMRIEGQYLSARAIDERVRLAITSPPNQLPWLFPQNQNGEDRATEANREIVDQSKIDDWVPSYELTANGATTTGTLLSCDRAHRPAEFSGFDMISIVDLDLSIGLGDSFDQSAAVGVMAGGQTVYSSTDRFYVATTKWVGADIADAESRLREWNEEFETDVHAFAISSAEPTRYVASGTINGSLLNQFSLDEHEGYLRAITTTGSPWGRNEQSETQLVVLEEQGDQLVAVGEVGGLGQGEQLFSARLMGDVGFAVTFRQIDPFYVLDLSDPTNPRVTGELKIPGVSTYLHPVGEDRVLGVGQDATEDGRVTGLKLSLFDVSDPADPQEIAVWTLDGANSPVEWDHRAFQMWGTTAIVPTQTWDQTFNGAVLFDVGDGITEIGRVSHVADGAQPSSDCRTLTADDVPEDTELFWMVNDGTGHVQLCDDTDRGGYGTWPCEPIPLDDLQYWIGDPAAADDAIAKLGADGGDRIEICWPDGGYQEAIQRSLVVDGTLWTTTPSAIQANAIDGLGVVAQFPLR